MRSFLLDLSCVVRRFRATPFFTSVSACILALGFAFNAIVFSVVNSVLLRPLPYLEPDKLVILQGEDQHAGSLGDLTAPMFLVVREHDTSLEDVAAIYPSDIGVNLAGAGNASYVKALQVSQDFFKALRAEPVIGKVFDDNEDKSNGGRVAILSHALWMRTARQGVGMRLRINGEDYTAIGVMPKGFRSYPEADLWLPLQLGPGTAGPGTDYRVIARLRHGATIEQATAELRDLSKAYLPAQSPATGSTFLRPQLLKDFETRDVREKLLFLWIAVFLVLLIACANIAMLLLVRSSARAHEIAIRTALGSPRRRLFQMFMLEISLLVLLGWILGIILAKELLSAAVSLTPPGLPLSDDIRIHLRIVIFTFGVAALTAVILGSVSLTKLAQIELNQMLRATLFWATSHTKNTRTGRVLLVAQTALTLVLLAASSLLLRHLFVIKNISPGFDVHHAYVAQVSLAARTYETTTPTVDVLERIIQRFEAIPSVEQAASISGLPLERGLNMPMHAVDEGATNKSGEYRIIDRDYFAVMRIPIVQGSGFTPADGAGTQPVVIVNETLARRWWPGKYAPGHFLIIGEGLGHEFNDTSRLVVGVVGDVHQSSLEASARPTVFIPAQQAPDKINAYANKYFLTSIVARTKGSNDISESVRNAVASSDPNLWVASFRPLQQVVANSLMRDRFYAYLTGIFGGFALAITAIGLYGLLSYQVSLRQKEIAVRLSLGAKRAQVVLLLTRQGIELVGIGVLLGVMCALFFKRLFTIVFYNLQGVALDALAIAVLLLVGISVLASLITAIRVASIEPMVILRNQ